MLLASALAMPFALLGLLMAMSRVEEALGGAPLPPAAPAESPDAGHAGPLGPEVDLSPLPALAPRHELTPA